MKRNNNISDELLAAYLDGNTSEAETEEVLDALESDGELREIMGIAMQVDNNCQLSTLNCQLSIVNCQLHVIFHCLAIAYQRIVRFRDRYDADVLLREKRFHLVALHE